MKEWKNEWDEWKKWINDEWQEDEMRHLQPEPESYIIMYDRYLELLFYLSTYSSFSLSLLFSLFYLIFSHSERFMMDMIHTK